MAGTSIVSGIVGQARPILMGQCAVMAFAVVDTVLCGHASAVDLATVGLGLSVYSTVFVGLMGATNALNPIVAQHFGGGPLGAIGAAYVQGLWMALFLSALGVFALVFGRLWLPWLHAPSEVEAHVVRYLRVLALALPGALMFRAIYSLNTAVSRPHGVMAMQLAALALKVCLSYLLILGGLGLPRLGAVGGAVASAVVFWALFLMGFAYMRRSPFYRRFTHTRQASVEQARRKRGEALGLSRRARDGVSSQTETGAERRLRTPGATACARCRLRTP